VYFGVFNSQIFGAKTPNDLPEYLVDLPIIEIQLMSQFSHDSILDFVTVRAADLCAPGYRECKDNSVLFWSHALQGTFFAEIAFCTSWFHPVVTLLPLFVTLIRWWYAVCKSPSYMFVCQGLPLYSLRSPGLVRLCRPVEWRIQGGLLGQLPSPNVCDGPLNSSLLI